MERGLARREAEGLDNSEINPVCTIMVGRLDGLAEGSSGQAEYLRGPRALCTMRGSPA